MQIPIGSGSYQGSYSSEDSSALRPLAQIAKPIRARHTPQAQQAAVASDPQPIGGGGAWPRRMDCINNSSD